MVKQVFSIQVGSWDTETRKGTQIGNSVRSHSGNGVITDRWPTWTSGILCCLWSSRGSPPKLGAGTQKPGGERYLGTEWGGTESVAEVCRWPTGLPAVGGNSGQAEGLCLMQFVMTERKKKVLGQNLHCDVVSYKGLHFSLMDPRR